MTRQILNPEIVDLEPKYHHTYFKCLEDWSDEMSEAGDHKACWFKKFKSKGLRVKLAVNERDEVVGMIQYLPIEESFVAGEALYVILCIWVHGYDNGIGNFQGKGIGTRLLDAAEIDVRLLGAKGMAAWGLWLPIWMKSSWFKKHGYKKADREALTLLMWKSFCHDAVAPKWIHAKKQIALTSGKVTVTAFINGWCPAQNIVFERAKRACAELGENVIFNKIDTSNRAVFLQWGISDGIYINRKRVSHGPPLSYEKLLRKITKKVQKLNTEMI